MTDKNIQTNDGTWHYLHPDTQQEIFKFISDLSDLLITRRLSKHFYALSNKILFSPHFFLHQLGKVRNHQEIFNFINFFFNHMIPNETQNNLDFKQIFFDVAMSQDVKQVPFLADSMLNFNKPLSEGNLLSASAFLQKNKDIIQTIATINAKSSPDKIKENGPSHINGYLINRAQSMKSMLEFLCNLSGLDLSKAIARNLTNKHGGYYDTLDFTLMVLKHTKFDNLDIRVASFHFSWLQHASFIQTILTSSDFRNSILEGANFSNASLKDVRFENSNLSHTNFSHATLTNVKFIHCSLLKADFSCTEFNECLDDIAPQELNTIKFIPDIDTTKDITKQLLTSLEFLNNQIKNSRHASKKKSAVAHNVVRIINNLVEKNICTPSEAKEILTTLISKSPLFRAKKASCVVNNAIHMGFHLFGKSDNQTPFILSNSQKILHEAILVLNKQIYIMVPKPHKKNHLGFNK